MAVHYLDPSRKLPTGNQTNTTETLSVGKAVRMMPVASRYRARLLPRLSKISCFQKSLDYPHLLWPTKSAVT